MLVANGRDKDIIRRIINGERVGTLFKAKERMQARKRWIAYGSQTHGT
jgi:glutamate 5-kinase